MRMRAVVGLGLALGASGLGGCFIELSSDDVSPPATPPMGPAPEVFAADVAPPSITGGTLLVTTSGRAVAADPDRDLVWIVDLATSPEAVQQVALEAGDEPGRVVAGADERVHVALRRGGALVTIDSAHATIVRRSEVCAAPRGVAFDEVRASLLVACVGGQLVEIAEATGVVVRRTQLVDDLR